MGLGLTLDEHKELVKLQEEQAINKLANHAMAVSKLRRLIELEDIARAGRRAEAVAVATGQIEQWLEGLVSHAPKFTPEELTAILLNQAAQLFGSHVGFTDKAKSSLVMELTIAFQLARDEAAQFRPIEIHHPQAVDNSGDKS